MRWQLNEKTHLLVDAAELSDPELERRAVRDEDDEPTGSVTVLVTGKIVLCHTCEGRGQHSLHLGAFSGERLEEARADTEWWDDYVAGNFDKKCGTCDGNGRYHEPDPERNPARLLELIHEDDEAEAEIRAEQRAERRMLYGHDGYDIDY